MNACSQKHTADNELDCPLTPTHEEKLSDEVNKDEASNHSFHSIIAQDKAASQISKIVKVSPNSFPQHSSRIGKDVPLYVLV